MSLSGSRSIGFIITAVLAVLLVLAFALRLPCGREAQGPASARAPSSGAAVPSAARSANTATVSGPTAAEARAAIDRALPWLEQTRIRPVGEGLERIRFFTMEVHSWFTLYAFADDKAQKERYRREAVERLKLLGDGSALADFLTGARMPDLIADVLMLEIMARSLEVPLPALERALPALYERGSDPRRPAAVQITLAWLAGSAGLDVQPSLEQLRPQGMLQMLPREITMKAPDVYYLTHEIFALTDYGFRRGSFAPETQAYLERSLSFWALLNAILEQTDLEAEIAICHQAAGTTGTYGYGEGLRYLLTKQTPDGGFGESNLKSDDPYDIRLGRLHTMMVALHALLGHEALLQKGALPGWPALRSIR